MKTLRLLGTVILLLGLGLVGATPAGAAPPGNDEPGGAIVIRLGTRVVQDTTQATTTAQDAVLNEDCGAPETNASVWYQYTPGRDRNIVLDAQGSDYTTGVMAFEGPPSGDTLIACGPDQVPLTVSAGQIYYFMVFSDTSVNGGQMVLSMKKAPPPPRVSVTLARRGVAFRGGAARVHGVYFCQRADFAEVYGRLMQRAGRLKIPADFYTELVCNGRRHAWSARAVSEVGTFARGRAQGRVTIDACGFFECREDTAAHRVRLRWAKAHGKRVSELRPSARLAPPRPLVQQQRHWVDR